MAPEVTHPVPFKFQPDIWAAGVVLFVMFHARYPYPIHSSPFTERTDYDIEPAWGEISDELRALLKGMFAGAAERLTAAQVMQSEYLIGEFKETTPTAKAAEATTEKDLSAREATLRKRRLVFLPVCGDR
eukprot:TRINITY_DN13959_c0_g1_i2.p1 TRINITY_DN13959_c0_g1~~TRINITY_DN13959_c0_g1_i2.p1  ORF type:complete len:130 (+),score=13.09 TRINITY_DN13959_c0_g1_i2:311-700(+)